MHSSLLMFTAALNSALPFWVPLLFEFRVGIRVSGTFLCSMSVLLVKIVLLLGWGTVANVICRDADVFGIKTASLKLWYILNY
jgi:hypothetical protein